MKHGSGVNRYLSRVDNVSETENADFEIFDRSGLESLQKPRS